MHWPKILILELIGGGRGQNHPQVWTSLQIIITDFCSKEVGWNLTAKNGFRGQNPNFKAPKKHALRHGHHSNTSMKSTLVLTRQETSKTMEWPVKLHIRWNLLGDQSNFPSCIALVWSNFIDTFLGLICLRLQHTESHHPRSSLQDNTSLLFQKRRLRKATCTNWMSPITPPSASPEQICRKRQGPILCYFKRFFAFFPFSVLGLTFLGFCMPVPFQGYSPD